MSQMKNYELAKFCEWIESLTYFKEVGLGEENNDASM